MIKRFIKIICVSLIILNLVSCDLHNEPSSFEYNGKIYIDHCDYGNVELFWELNTKDLTEITVCSDSNEHQGHKASNDEQELFIKVFDALFVRKDSELPSVETQGNNITKISFYFVYDRFCTVSAKEDIRKFTQVILEATSKTEETEDNDIELLANVSVRFEEFPADLLVGKLVTDADGNVYFSSNLNPISHYRIGLKAKSWYTVPINTIVKENKKLSKIVEYCNETGDGFVS